MDSDINVDEVYLSFDDDVQKAAYKVLTTYDFVSNDKVHVISKDEIDKTTLDDVKLDEQLVLSKEEDANSEALVKFVEDSNKA